MNYVYSVAQPRHTSETYYSIGKKHSIPYWLTIISKIYSNVSTQTKSIIVRYIKYLSS